MIHIRSACTNFVERESKTVFWNVHDHYWIRRRSDYIIGFIAPAIGPNKSKKLTRLIALAHNIHGKVWMKNNIHGFTDRHFIVCETMYIVFQSNFAAYIVCRSYKRCEFLGFVWTDCRGNKPYYVITSPANSKVQYLLSAQSLDKVWLVMHRADKEHSGFNINEYSDINGSQLAKMIKQIPCMSLP